MCGILGVAGKRAARTVLQGLHRLEYRGYDSWGMTAVAAPGVLWVKKGIGPISEARSRCPVQATMALGHTRWATHGGITVNNAHPHASEANDLASVHNGIIENYAAIQAELLTRGHHFRSETDSEVVVHLYEEYVTTSPPGTAMRRVLARLVGRNAAVIIDATRRILEAGTTGSPLVVADTPNGFMVASDSGAFTQATSVYFLQPGETATITNTRANIRQANGTPYHGEWSTPKAQKVDTGKGRFPHFMLKEINDQPALIRRHAENRWPLVAKPAQALPPRLILSGCGSAYHAALAGSVILRRAGTWAQAIVASELQPYLPELGQQPVWFLSQSGETADVLEPAQCLHDARRPVWALVNRPHSTLSRLANRMIPLDAGTETAVVATKSFLAKLVTLMMVSAAKQGSTAIKRVRGEMETAAGVIEECLSPAYAATHIDTILHALGKTQHILIIGRGMAAVMAAEMALKIKESAYVPAEALPGGELKHGTLALVTPGTPVIALCPNDETEAAMTSNSVEVRARGGIIIGFAPTNQPHFNAWIPVPDCGQATCLVQTVVGQLLAYHLAVTLGRNPDRPRNLAKSVTVK